jgi:calcineurin-like phosphoesterase
VFGVPGRRAVEERLPTLREELAADFCVVNGENAADGAGITPRIADRILAAGGRCNHAWQLTFGDGRRSGRTWPTPSG